MSRPSSMMLPPSSSSIASSGTARTLSLTEELEKLEQSITLTLQEIDHNFNKCHRIVTHSIMPVLDKFADESAKVQDGSKFWKSFFERSAEMACGYYEEDVTATNETLESENTATNTTDETYEEETEDTFTQSRIRSSVQESSPVNSYASGKGHKRPQSRDVDDSADLDLEDESILNSMNLDGNNNMTSTPRAKEKDVAGTRWANMSTQFEAIRREHEQETKKAGQGRNHRNGVVAGDAHMESSSILPPPIASGRYDLSNDSSIQPPTTPDTIRQRPAQARKHIATETPDSSPLRPIGTTDIVLPPTTGKRSKHDILLHRAVDTKWRLQATPLSRQFQTSSNNKPTTPRHQKPSSQDLFDSSPFSPEPPQLTTVFSPVISRYASHAPASTARSNRLQQTPGSDVKTPLSTRQRQQQLRTRPANVTPIGKQTKYTSANIDDDDDDDIDFGDLGFSPPVTMQFSMPPSKLLQTPAREASKKMVREIMQSAGVREGDSSDLMPPDSPSMLYGREPTDEF